MTEKLLHENVRVTCGDRDQNSCLLKKGPRRGETERKDTRGFSVYNGNAVDLYLGGHLEYSYAKSLSFAYKMCAFFCL